MQDTWFDSAEDGEDDVEDEQERWADDEIGLLDDDSLYYY